MLLCDSISVTATVLLSCAVRISSARLSRLECSKSLWMFRRRRGRLLALPRHTVWAAHLWEEASSFRAYLKAAGMIYKPVTS